MKISQGPNFSKYKYHQNHRQQFSFQSTKEFVMQVLTPTKADKQRQQRWLYEQSRFNIPHLVTALKQFDCMLWFWNNDT